MLISNIYYIVISFFYQSNHYEFDLCTTCAPNGAHGAHIFIYIVNVHHFLVYIHIYEIPPTIQNYPINNNFVIHVYICFSLYHLDTYNVYIY